MVDGPAVDRPEGYTLRTLGEFCVIELGQRKAQGPARESALLLYLALNIGQYQPREKLIALLWDTGASRERRHSLSQLLYSLKQRYPLLELSATRDAVCLGDGVSYVDSLRLLELVDGGDTEAACEIYSGRFLDGFSINGANGFEEWRESFARSLDGAGSRALAARLREADGAGRWWLVEETANRLLELDPYDEHVHATRIRSIVADGDHGRAVRELDRAIDLIRRDLEQLPGPELRKLISHLASGTSPNHVETHERAARHRFVGRAVEFRELRSIWSSVSAGRGAAVAICGEAGIGKSRLCTQLLRVVAVEGGRVLDGRCFESTATVPYSGICQALGAMREADLVLTPPHWRLPLEQLLPELSTKSRPAGESVQARAEWGRRQLFEAVVHLVKAIARHGPVALFIDDVQWSDVSTTELLQYIVQATRDDRVLVVVAVRPEELSRDELTKRLDGFIALALEPLVDDDAMDLVMAAERDYAPGLSVTDRRKILTRCAGRPFLIIEFMRHLGAQLELSRLAQEPETAIDDIPAAAEALLCRRLRDLNKAAARTANVLAVVGGEATITLLERATRLPTPHVVAALEELQHRQIIRESRSGYSFTHDLMREAVERRLSSARRRWLHKALATALQCMPGPQVGAIAMHLHAAGDRASAYGYALDAAAHSGSLFAHSETAFFLRLAATTAPDVASRLVALDRLCRHYYSLGDLLTVRKILPEVRAWYARQGDREGLLMVAVSELDAALCDGTRAAIDLRRRATVLAELVAESPYTTEGSAVALILRAAQTAYQAGHKEFIRTFADAIHREASRGPASSNRVRHLSASSMAYALYIGAAEGYQRATAALRHAEDLADPASELAAQLACGSTGTASGMYADAYGHFARAWELLDNDALQHSRRQLAINYAVLLMETGRLAEARRLLLEIVDAASSHERLYLFGNLAVIAIEEQDWDSVREYAAGLEAANRVLKASWADASVRMLNGFLALAAGEHGRARTIAVNLNDLNTAGSEIMALMLDPSYANILFARVGLLGSDAVATADSLNRLADICRDTNVGAAARLDLERARVLGERAPDAAAEVAREVLSWAARSGATLAADRAREILQASRAGP